MDPCDDVLHRHCRDDGDNAAFATVRSVCWQWRAVADRFAPLVMGLAMNGGDANSTPGGGSPRQSAEDTTR